MTHLPPTPEHPELAVAVASVGIRACDYQGRRFDAEIFLHEEGERRSGPETLEDRLNDPDGRFLPCRIDGEMQILHLDRLAWMELDGMTLLNDFLVELVEKDLVEPEDAYLKAAEKDDLVNRFKAKDIDTSYVEEDAFS